MRQFLIILNQIEGVDLIVKALRTQAFNGCIASGDLADGIEQNVQLMDSQGNIRPMPEKKEEPKRKTFTVLKGGNA